jgi:hypothetical protein
MFRACHVRFRFGFYFGSIRKSYRLNFKAAQFHLRPRIIESFLAVLLVVEVDHLQ